MPPRVPHRPNPAASFYQRVRRLAIPLLLLAAPASAMDGPGVRLRQPSWAETQAGLCLDGIASAERRNGTLPGLLSAVARAESGRPVPPLPGLQPWPWAVNADGGAY